MKTSELCAAVWEAPDWLARFRRREYPQAFQEYQERFGSLYAQAVEETEGDLTTLEGLANDILDELEAGWNRRFWNRGAVRVEEKQVIVSFLSPMLLELPPPPLRAAGGDAPTGLGRPLAQGRVPDHDLCGAAKGLPKFHTGHRSGRQVFGPLKKSQDFEKTV